MTKFEISSLLLRLGVSMAAAVLTFGFFLLCANSASAAVLGKKTYTIMDNIAVSQASSQNAWYVMSLKACKRGGTKGAKALAKEAITCANNGSAEGSTTLQRDIIGLTAAGYDASAVSFGSGTCNLVSVMAKAVDEFDASNIRISTLLAYGSGGYSVPKDAQLSKGELLRTVLNDQCEDGGWTFRGDIGDVDMTSLAVCSLIPCKSEDSEVSRALHKARRFLKKKQHEDGGFGTLNATLSNSNSTAFAVIALCALGIDPTVKLNKGVPSPMKGLMSFADESMSGFKYGDNLNDLSTEQCFRALVASCGQKTEGVYNIYTRAKAGTATFRLRQDKPSSQAKGKGKASAKESSANSSDKGSATGSTAKDSKKSASSDDVDQQSASNKGKKAGSEGKDSGNRAATGNEDEGGAALQSDQSANLEASEQGSTGNEPDATDNSAKFPVLGIVVAVAVVAAAVCAAVLTKRRRNGQGAPSQESEDKERD